jgi:Plant transposon protein
MTGYGFGHYFFGIPGSRNDLNIMNASPLFQSIRAGSFPPARPSTTVDDLDLTWYYFLVDSIYPRYRIFLTTYTRPSNNKEKMLARVQEGARKAVDRLFAVLFSRWYILHRPARGWHVDDVVDILTACCILHNMIIEDREDFDEESTVGTRNILSFDDTASPSDIVLLSPAKTRQAQAQHWRGTADLVENTEHHFKLKRAVANHLWNKHGAGDNFE